jgi:hypothetical protein
VMAAGDLMQKAIADAVLSGEILEVHTPNRDVMALVTQAASAVRPLCHVQPHLIDSDRIVLIWRDSSF